MCARYEPFEFEWWKIPEERKLVFCYSMLIFDLKPQQLSYHFLGIHRSLNLTFFPPADENIKSLLQVWGHFNEMIEQVRNIQIDGPKSKWFKVWLWIFNDEGQTIVLSWSVVSGQLMFSLKLEHKMNKGNLQSPILRMNKKKKHISKAS